jgi:hypothetical protein
MSKGGRRLSFERDPFPPRLQPMMLTKIQFFAVRPPKYGSKGREIPPVQASLCEVLQPAIPVEQDLPSRRLISLLRSISFGRQGVVRFEESRKECWKRRSQQ